LKKLKKDKLHIKICESREDMGKTAAIDLIAKLKEMTTSRKYNENIRMLFASAPSQNDFFAHLWKMGSEANNIDFSKITAFHLDEYIGLSQDAPQGFGNFLKERLFSKLSFGEVHYIDSQATDPEAECQRYTALLKEKPIDIICMGIGENGHIAFNDPHVADFNDPKTVKVVELDNICRQQQVNDGCFARLADVPTHAITLTIPALVNAKAIFCMVPAISKANAVYHCLESPISEEHPATILRTVEAATLYLDPDSSSRV